MKKNAVFFTVKSNKKKTMINSKQASKKKNNYIYTEADLGEGILDEGVNPAYYTAHNENLDTGFSCNNIISNLLFNKNNGLEIVNVEEDFNYAYYL